MATGPRTRSSARCPAQVKSHGPHASPQAGAESLGIARSSGGSSLSKPSRRWRQVDNSALAMTYSDPRAVQHVCPHRIGAGRLRTSLALVVWRKRAWRLRIVRRSDAVGLEVLPNTGSWKRTLAWLSRNRALLVTWNATPHRRRICSPRNDPHQAQAARCKHLVTNLHFPDGRLFTLKYVSDQKIR